MAAIGFYHLTRDNEAGALARLLARTLAAAHRAVVSVGEARRLPGLDDELWAVDAVPFLPHGIDHAPLQPVLLTADAADVAAPPNGADFLFLVAGAPLPDPLPYARVFDLFDGRDPAALAAARLRWQQGRADGHALTYWREGPKGWEQGP